MFPKLIDTGRFFLPTYGVLVALAFLAGIAVTTRLGRRVGLKSDSLTNLAIYCALAGMAGAKLFMFLFDWQVYAAKPSIIFSMSTLQAAGVFQGGLIAALAMAWWYTRKHSLPVALTADVFAPGVALGHAIGRLGCFAAGCCWGTQCDRPWAVTFTSRSASELTGVPLFVPLHPTQLYEVAAELLTFVLLYFYFNRSHRDGSVIGWYLLLSSIGRFVIEFWRNHEQALPFGLPLSITQWIALGTLALGAWLVLRPCATRVVEAR